MKKLKIGFLQQHNTADTRNNIERLADGIADLAQRGAQLVVLQELHNTLYFCQTEDVEKFDMAETIPGLSTELYGELARRYHVVIVTSLFERRAPGLYHNTAVVIESDGTIAGQYRKMHIPDDPGYYEKFYFTPGDQGFVPIDTSVGRLGVMVCWDQWYPEAARLMALAGAELLIYPTAIGYASEDTPDEQQRQRQAWQTVMRGHAVANGLPVVAVNRVGWEQCPMDNGTHESGSTATEGAQGSSINFWGTSFVCGPQGEIIYEASEDDEESIIVDMSMERSEQVRRWWPFLRDRRIDEYGGIVRRYLATLFAAVVMPLAVTAQEPLSTLPSQQAEVEMLPMEPVEASADDDDGLKATVDVDILSHYIWRGQDKCGLSIQPEAQLTWKGLYLSAEGSTGLQKDDLQEIDLGLGFRKWGFNIGVFDYWTTGLDSENRYFYYDNKNGAHQFEANLGYKCKYFSLQAYTMFWGNDFKLDGSRAYSTYIELGVPFTVGDLDWQLTAGITPMESAGHWEMQTHETLLGEREVNVRVWDYSEAFGCCVASLRCTKDIDLGDVRMPVFAELYTNPYLQKATLVFGLSIKPW